MLSSPAIPCRTIAELRAAIATLPDDAPVESNDGDYVVIYHPCSMHHGVIIDSMCESGSWKSKTPNAPQTR